MQENGTKLLPINFINANNKILSKCIYLLMRGNVKLKKIIQNVMPISLKYNSGIKKMGINLFL